MRKYADEHRMGGGGPLAVPLAGVAVAGRQSAAPAVALPPRTRTAYERFVKPIMDRVLGATLLVIAAPLMLGIALAIFLRLGAPLLLRQPRVGLDGRVFYLYKFRTMRPDRRARDVEVPEDRRRTHKHPEDPRLVPLGRFLRRWSLDELPQLLNVVRGHMSLVGPRPELVSIVQKHYAPWQHQRHQVKPGLTGLWQVTERDLGQMHEHTLTDLRYLDDISLRSDLRILLLTLPAALGLRKGF